MMNYVWAGMLIVGLVWGVATGRSAEVAAALTDGASEAVTLCITLGGAYMLWMGIMNVASDCGLIEGMARLFEKPLRLLFPKTKRAVAPITLNLAANLFGAAGAATPFGLEAMRLMSEEAKKPAEATDDMCMFIALNSAAIELVPAGVLALRTAAGSKDAYCVVLPTFICSLICFSCAAVLAKLFCKIFPEKKERRK